MRLFLQGPKQAEAQRQLYEDKDRLWTGSPPSSHSAWSLALAQEGQRAPGQGVREWSWGFWPGRRLLVLILGSRGFWAYQQSFWPGKGPMCINSNHHSFLSQLMGLLEGLHEGIHLT